MRLFEAIVSANQRAVHGDTAAGVHPAEHAEALPLVALTCIDARLNPLLPEVLGIPEEQFIWLRNAGNIITGPLSSTMRSLALACAVKGGREIAVIGHTDCLVAKTPTMELLERFKTLGVDRARLPENLTEFFGTFSSERQNVITAATIVRNSPLIGSAVPVHGILVDIQTGALEWLVNGYETTGSIAQKWNDVLQNATRTIDSIQALTDFKIGPVDFQETAIGQKVMQATQWVEDKVKAAELASPATHPQTPPAVSPPVIHQKQPSIRDQFRPRLILKKPQR